MGIFFVSTNNSMIGFIAIGLGIICLLTTIFLKRNATIKIVLSGLAIIVASTLLNIQPISTLVDTAFDSFSNITKDISPISQNPNIANVKRIWVSAIWIGGGRLYVELIPAKSAIADKSYVVELYEGNNLRAFTRVSWNQPEINVGTMRLVVFPATRAEANAYSMKHDLRNIFSVKVHDGRGEGK